MVSDATLGSFSSHFLALRAVAGRPGPSFRALLFGTGAGAVFGALKTASFLRSSESRQLVFLEVPKATLGSGGRCPQARSVPGLELSQLEDS